MGSADFETTDFAFPQDAVAGLCADAEYFAHLLNAHHIGIVFQHVYCIVKRNRFIFLNKDLSPQMKRIVCAHEIGHDRLHRALAKKHGLQEFVLYDMATKPEYEANIVAAEILLDSDEILEYIYDYGYTSEQIARAMHTDINLVALKIAHLAETGHKLRRMEYRSSFLK
ncbi:ImmA/IrrE family metallo-endopeptidase [Oscillibacter sp.]|uniref:ImmA/IrrE family metallo-endopeptidase n=1 Tax=Oscillibacter sp. TaxID=1945593 RepID=UPI00338E8164